MDQGLAALLAGVFGLVGAGLGGVGAIWGAKVGAQTAAKATRQQLWDQALVEHEQWLREARREAYEAFITGLHQAMESFHAVMEAARGGEDLGEARRLMHQHLNALLTLGVKVQLVGTRAVDQQARQSSRQLDEMADVLGGLAQSEVPSQEVWAALYKAAEENDKFGDLACQILQAPAAQQRSV